MRAAVYLSPSRLDSIRFGMKVVRGSIPASAPENATLNDIRALEPDVAIFRCPAGDRAQVKCLTREGYSPVHADTLIYYKGALARIECLNSTTPGEEILRAGESDDNAIRVIAELGFSSYRSHYHANPRFGGEQILAGYIEWATAYAGPGTTDVEAWVVKQDGEVIGFATCCASVDTSTLEIPLIAIHPNHSGRGVYTRLVGALMYEYKRLGISAISVSTQVWNYAVQRAWVRLGLSPDHAVETYHVNLPMVRTEA